MPIQRWVLVGILVLVGLVGCSPDSSQESIHNFGSTSPDLNVTLRFANQTAPLNGLILGTITDVTSVTLDISQGGTPIVTAAALTSTLGIWGVTLPDLPSGTQLTFVAHAFNASVTEIFTGTTTAFLSDVASTLNISMVVVDDATPLTLPRIRSIIYPTDIQVSTTATVAVEVENWNSGETLAYIFTPGTNGGSFTPASGTTVVAGTIGTFSVTYNAPAQTANFTHSVLVTNSQNNFVIQDFTTLVTATGPVAADLAPLVTNIQGVLSGTSVTFTPTIVEVGTITSYSWTYSDGTLTPLAFTDPTVSPAVLQNYVVGTSGMVTLQVTDNLAQTTTVRIWIPQDRFPNTTAVNFNPLRTRDWIAVSAGTDHTLAIRDEGTPGQGSLWSWGGNTNGQLGQGVSQIGTNRLYPTRIGTGSIWKAVVAGERYSLALKTDGTVWSWGVNGWGQLGVGDTVDRDVPTQVTGLTGIASIAGGGLHGLAINGSGNLYAWGYNGNGQLGDGTTTFRSAPVAIGAAVGTGIWSKIGAGYFHSLGVQSDGKIYSWGLNDNGQLGLGDLLQYTTPQLVGALSDWASPAIHGDAYNSLALKIDGTLFAWGLGTSGQLGVGDTTDRTAPQLVGVSTDTWNVVSGGYSSSMAIKSDGRLWGWGSNNSNELGIAMGGVYATPTLVNEGTTWTAVSAGYWHGMGLKNDGSLWAWGFYNTEGKLGVGDTTGRLIPTEVRP